MIQLSLIHICVTMATAMLSAITGTPVRADVAMTGEITLRGRVLPIGGLREKSIAAKVAGIHTVIVPEKNRRDIKELDKEITKDLKFVYASTMADILPVSYTHLDVYKRQLSLCAEYVYRVFDDRSWGIGGIFWLYRAGSISNL